MQTYLQTRAAGSTELSFMGLLKQHGFARLWRGAPAMLAACVPSHTAYFSVYEAAKENLGVNQPGHHPLGAAAAGACATTMHDLIITPMDLVKQRLQLGYYSGVWNCISTVARDEGIGALFRAFPTTLVMNIPYASIVVATNESAKEALNPSGEHSMGVYLASGALSGAVAALATNPLDVIKTRLQTQQCVAVAVEACAIHSESIPAMPSGGASAPSGGGSSPAVAASVRRAAARIAGSATSLLGVNPATLGQLYSGGASTSAAAAAAGVAADDCACGVKQMSGAPKYTGIVDAARKIMAEEGGRGFFRGVKARVALHTPAMAISWGTYEAVKKALQRM
jgi:solute carrier family 25 iron transporter 28/37